MSCCGHPTTEPEHAGDPALDKSGLEQWSRDVGNGISHIELLAPGIHCAGCISRIEKKLKAEPGVTLARVNLSTRRISLEWQSENADPATLVNLVEDLGYNVRPFNAEEAGLAHDDAVGRELLRALAVAGFSTANIMLLSVSVWSGAEGETRDLFHWLSALIAIPAVGYAGQPFFRSAWAALSRRSLNMDVPISLAVLLATGMSVYETSIHGKEAFFDASVTLLFFLLIGRYLDHMMRARARSAVTQLLSLNATGATIVKSDGTRVFLQITEIKPGMVVEVAAGEKFPADGVILEGKSDVDRAMVTGESMPEFLEPGAGVQAGSVNLTGPVSVTVSAAGEDTFLAEIVRLMEAAEQGKAGYMRIADRAARIYAPAVHIISALTFLGWMWWSGGDWRVSIFAAVAVLIITCPCALGLAVPAVQIVASGMLFKRGVFLKDGTALERLADIDTVLFDKTGTLTLGSPTMTGPAVADPDMLAIAGGLARHSKHPLSRAVVRSVLERGIEPALVTEISEHPGRGLEGTFNDRLVRLGNRVWCDVEDHVNAPESVDGQLELCLRIDAAAPVFFTFEGALREDAEPVARQFIKCGFGLGIISGDREPAVRHVAGKTGIVQYCAGWTPQEKASYISSLQNAGKKVLMVGDGINDAPALAAAHASIAPSSASDVGRMAADLVFIGSALQPVYTSWKIAKLANRHIFQNFALAVAYNLVAVPIAVLGFASPLVAAIAMSASSLLVTGNALRLRLRRGLDPEVAADSETTISGRHSANDPPNERHVA
jgi:Cu2+-exporting ATPase